MRRPFLLLAAVVFASFASIAPQLQAITPEEAAAAVGQSTTVTGTIVKAYKSKVGVLYLNFGGEYPNQSFTVIAKKDVSANFPEVSTYQGKVVSVTGMIVKNKDGKPEIEVKTPEEIVFADAATAASPAASPSPSAAK